MALVRLFATPARARLAAWPKSKVLVRPEVEKAASDLSEQFYCGRAGWALAIDIDVVGPTCNGAKAPPANAQVHQIGQVDGDALYLGSASSGSGATPAERPNVLSKTHFQRAR